MNPLKLKFKLSDSIQTICFRCILSWDGRLFEQISVFVKVERHKRLLGNISSLHCMNLKLYILNLTYAYHRCGKTLKCLQCNPLQKLVILYRLPFLFWTTELEQQITDPDYVFQTHWPHKENNLRTHFLKLPNFSIAELKHPTSEQSKQRHKNLYLMCRDCRFITKSFWKILSSFLNLMVKLYSIDYWPKCNFQMLQQ